MSRPKLKPLSEQAIVITGATSGIGLATAQLAAARGARVMLAARNVAALRGVSDAIRSLGGTAEYFATDVADQVGVEALAVHTIERFGGFDTWVNNAGVGVYSTIAELNMATHRRVFETNYWGVVHGSVVALKHLSERGGAIINMGSINSDMPAPLLGSYNASKHAVKGFTDTLRLEVLASGLPVSITLIKPGPIATPFPAHGRNFTGYAARLPQPLYTPEVVARAILHAAAHPRRSVTIGGVGKFEVIAATVFPGVFDRIASRMGSALVNCDQPTGRVEGNLFEPTAPAGSVAGEQSGRSFSTFTAAARYPLLAGVVAAALVTGGAIVRGRVRRSE